MKSFLCFYLSLTARLAVRFRRYESALRRYEWVERLMSTATVCPTLTTSPA